jgi:hypothetical protein
MLSDADLLDAVRKLRANLSALDNVHVTLDLLKPGEVEEDFQGEIGSKALLRQKEIRAVTAELTSLLHRLEATKQYKAMLRKYNISEEP